MKKKLRLIILIVVILILVICFIKSTKMPDNGNSSNMGLAIENNGTVYYNKYEKGIFALKNGQEKQLTDETAYSLNIVGNTIYYLTVADFNNVVIKSVDTNGENINIIAVIYTSLSKIYIEDGYIYYSTNKDSGKIAKIDLNGENESIVIDASAQDFQVVDGCVYYVDQANQICKVDTSGNNQEVLKSDSNVNRIQVIDKWIYYYDNNENALFRIKKDGQKNELVSVLVNNEIYNVCGKYVYYLDNENLKISRMKIGKSNECEDIVYLNIMKTKINIVGDEMYYLDKSQDNSQVYQMYKIKLNGDDAGEIVY